MRATFHTLKVGLTASGDWPWGLARPHGRGWEGEGRTRAYSHVLAEPLELLLAEQYGNTGGGGGRVEGVSHELTSEHSEFPGI